MLFQSAIDLKIELRGIPRAASVSGGFIKKASTSLPPAKTFGISLGVVPGAGAQDYRLAVRTTRNDPAVSNYVNTLSIVTNGEIDVQCVGQIQAIPPSASTQPWRKRSRPLLPGYSVAHEKSSAGTIGGFVKKDDDDVYVLSNSHVLALMGTANHHDAILQPGPYDGGKIPDDSIATLYAWVPSASRNHVDAALGRLNTGMQFDALYDGKRIGAPYRPEQSVDAWKVGRTTGMTKGKVTAIALDDVEVQFGSTSLFFDDQIEVEGTSGPFSEGGDSGSFILDKEDRPFGLLFAASTLNPKSYANQITVVLELLGVNLLR